MRLLPRLLPALAALWLLAAASTPAQAAPAAADTMWHDPHALLPKKLADWLITQGYRIPQASYDEQTVIAGEFIQPGQRDLVVLAERADSLHLLCFPGGRSAEGQRIVSVPPNYRPPWGNINWIEPRPETGTPLGVSLFIWLVRFEQSKLESFFASDGKPLPEHPTHQAIALYKYDKPSPYFYMFLDGRWQEFYILID